MAAYIFAGESNPQPTMENQNPICCPKCKSTQVHAHARGWTLGKGALGMGKVIITCLSCGCEFQPGGPAKKAKTSYTALLVVGILAAAWLAVLAFLNSN
jgi:hypothetical protein